MEILLSEEAPLKQAISYYFAEVSARRAAKQANVGFSTSSAMAELEIENLDNSDDEAPIIRLLNSLIERAIKTGASDVHIEPFEKETRVRMRIDGVIMEYVNIQRNIHAPLIARIKILSNLDIAERRLPQDGHFRVSLDDGQVNIRVSILPTVFGEKAVMRIMAFNGKLEHADHFGMDEYSYKQFAPLLNYPNGIIYITGPTGSGKSTTLYMILEYLTGRNINISTIEDPVEKNLPGINQTQVNPVAGLTFDVGLRALMRQDPDVIMVGETRDGETAGTSVRAAITGHVVLSTLHTNDAVSSIVRLEDMGVETYLVANSLVGLVAQRLLRKVCPNCAKEVETTAITAAIITNTTRATLIPPSAVKILFTKACAVCITALDNRSENFAAFTLNFATDFSERNRSFSLFFIKDRRCVLYSLFRLVFLVFLKGS